MFIMPTLLFLLLSTNLGIFNSANNFKDSIKNYHSLSSSLEIATQYLQYDLPLNIPTRVPKAEISINNVDIQYVAIIPIESEEEIVTYDIIAIADSTAAKMQVKALFEDETYSVQVIKDVAYTNAQNLIKQYNFQGV